MMLWDLLLLIGMWAVCSVVAGAYLGVIGAIAWKVMQWLL